VAAWDPAVEEIHRLDEGAPGAAPAAGHADVVVAAGQAVDACARDAAGHAAAVVRREVAGVLALGRACADRVDAGLEAVTARHELPLDGAGRASGEAGDARAVVLRTARGRRVVVEREVAADVARVELDRVQ